VWAASVQSPVVRTRLKGRHSEADEARAIQTAAYLWRNCKQPINVHYGRRIVGIVKGDPDNGRTLWFPLRAGQGFPWSDYDGVVKTLTVDGQYGTFYWVKPRDTAVVAHMWYDLWGAEGVPQAGDWSGTARTARRGLNTTTGAIYIPGGSVSTKKKWLMREGIIASEDNTIAMVLYDRVLMYDACTMTAGNQAMTNTLGATRYISAGDPGLQIFVEADTVHNATAANLTVLHYTNQAGTTAKAIPASLTKVVSLAAPTTTLGARNVFGAVAGPMSGDPYLVLASGDTAVQKLEDYTWSAAPTGTCSFTLQFPLALHPDIHGSVLGSVSDWEFVMGIETGNKRVYDDACLSWLMACRNTASSGQMHGYCAVGWV
jgi:hypothetical protein